MRSYNTFILTIISFVTVYSQPTINKRTNFESNFAINNLALNKSMITFSNLQEQDYKTIHKQYIPSNQKQIQWQQVYGPFGSTVRDFIQAKDGTVFLCSEGGIYRAKHIGGVWEKIDIPNTFNNVISTMFIHSNGVILAFGDFQIFRSIDNGNTWNISNIYADVRNVISDSLGNLYAASYRNGLLFSDDAGLSWKTIGLPTKNLLSISMTTTGKIICGSMDYLYISSNKGFSWDSVDVGGMNIYTVKQTKSGIIYALGEYNLFKSEDDGKTWSVITVVNDYLYRFYEGANNTLYVLGTFLGLQKSIDGGNNWNQTSLGNELPLCMFISNKDTMLVGHFDGVSLTKNGGKSWVRNDSGLVSLGISSIVENKKGDIIVSGGRKIYSSTDNGEHWQAKYLSSWSVAVLAIDSVGNMYASDSGGIIRSSNHGESWDRLNISALPYFISTITVKDTNTIFAGTSHAEVFRSLNGGKSWERILKDNREWFIDALAVDKNGNVYCGTLSSVFKSTDDGLHWKEMNSGSIRSSVNSIVCNDSYILVGSSNNGIYRSTDGGNRWDTFNNLLSTQNIQNMSRDTKGTLYAISTSGIYESKDVGAQWTSIVNGMQIVVYRQVFVTSQGYIFIGTQENGLFRSLSSNATVKSPINPINFSLFQNYPNPFNPTTTISYALPYASDVSLTVHDYLGRKVKTLVNNFQSSGIHEIVFEGNGLSSGIYFCKIKAGVFSSIKKMLLLK